MNTTDRVAAIRDIHRATSSSTTAANNRIYPRNRGYCEYVSDDGHLFQDDELLKQPLCCTRGTCGVSGFVPAEILNAYPYSSSIPIKEAPLPTERDVLVPTIISVRSQLAVSGICCSSETPQILAILQPIPGVQSVRVNTQLKSVLVEHNPKLVQANDIKSVLDREKFKAKIVEDGGIIRHDLLLSANLEEEQSRGYNMRSQLYVENICCAAEIQPIRSILESVNGIHEVSVNVTTKMVYIRHDVSKVGASEIELRLTKEGFRAQVIFDAARLPKSILTETDGTMSSSEDESVGTDIHSSKLNPFIAISGLFWVTSMLSYISRDW